MTMKNRSINPIACLGAGIAIAVAVLVLMCGAVLAGGSAQVIVELRQNASSGATTGARFSSQKIAGTDSATKQQYKFQRHREGSNFSYVIANLLPSKSYTIELSFVEHEFSSAGKRIFNAYIQSHKVISKLDIFASAGQDTAFQRSFTGKTDSKGLLTVQFRSDLSGCRDYAVISTVRLYRSSGDAVEIDAAASRNDMNLPVRHTNNSNQNTYETLLGRLGSRFSLNLLPQRLGSRLSSLGTGTGDLSDFVLALKKGANTRCLPFTDRYPVWESIQQSQTMTSQTFKCSSSKLPFQLTVTFRAPFYPRDEKISGAPFLYATVTVKNTGSAAATGQFVLARPHKRSFASSSFTNISTATEKGFYYSNYYNYRDETYNQDSRRGAVEALVVPTAEATDPTNPVVFKGPTEADFNDFTGSRLWTFDSPAGYPNTYDDPRSPIFSFYPRGYSGAVWSVSLGPKGSPTASKTKHFVVAGYVSSPVLAVKNNSYSDSTFRFKYRNDFSNVKAVVNYAVTSMTGIVEKSDFFDNTISSNSYFYLKSGSLSDVRSMIIYTFQSYLVNTWWAHSDRGREWFSVWEGNFTYHSTVDVEYNNAWFYFEYWPGLLRQIMDEWVMYKKSNAQGTYLSHDMGHMDAASGQVYPFDMPVEENANYILLLYRYWRSTGDLSYVRKKFSTVQQFVDFMINCDNNNNGLPDLNTRNTIDDASPAIHLSRDQTYLGVKCLAAFQAAREMAAGLPSPDPVYAAKCQGMVEQINQTLEYDLWLSDHYAVCLDGGVEPADREAYNIYPSNGLLYLLSARRNIGVTSNNIANMRADLVNATEKTLKQYGCAHSSYDAFKEWVSQNLFRDQVAAYLGTKLNGSNPLAMSDRYWKLAKYFATNLNGGFWDGVIYPGGGGPVGASAAARGGGPSISTIGAGSGYQQSLGYYPRGIASIGLIEAAAGLTLDVPADALHYQQTTAPLRVPVLSRTDWDNPVASKRVPVLYFKTMSGGPSVTNRSRLPAKLRGRKVVDLEDVSGGGHAMSPNGDGANDTVSVSYNLPYGSRVLSSIWEGAEKKREFDTVSQPSGAMSFKWDGKTDGGAVVDDGLYTARIDAQANDSTYSERPASAAVWVNRSIPDLSPDWYLAEGFTGRNATGGEFEEYVLIQNPNDQAANADVTFMLNGGATVQKSCTIAPNSRFTITVDEILPDAEVSTFLHSDRRIAVERAMYFNGRRAGHDSIGVSQPGTTWYLAEGYTAMSFDEYVLIMNPGAKEAGITATFMTPGKGNTTRKYNVGGHSRFTIHVDEILPAEMISTKIESTQPVVVERAQYLNNMTAGTCSIAARSTSRTWYLAEGYTDQGFEEYVLIQNPGAEYNNVTVTYMEKTGANTVKNYHVPPASRFTIGVDDILPKSEVSVKVRAASPVLVERAMYWNNRSDGHACIGTPSPDSEWYLAEGYTDQGFETWILVQNPSDSLVNTTFTFMENSGKNTVRTYQVKPRSRFTVGVDALLPASMFSTRVSADGPVIVERAVYFNNRSGGTDSLGIRGF